MRAASEYAAMAERSIHSLALVYAQLATAAAILEAAQPPSPRIETKTYGEHDDEA